MRGRIRGVCSREVARFMTTTIGNATRNGRLWDGASRDLLRAIDSEECKYAAESTSVFPVESKIESTRCKQETKTGIFY